MTINQATELRSQVLHRLQSTLPLNNSRHDQAQQADQIEIRADSQAIELPDMRKLLSAKVNLEELGSVESGTAQLQEGDARKTYRLEKSQEALGFLGLFGVQQEVTRCTVDTAKDGFLWRQTATFDQGGKVLFMNSYDATDLFR
jgi:hypothetical protein